MNKFRIISILVTLVMLFSFASISPVAAEDTCTSSGIPAVSTDLDDYDPFGTVTISGSGFGCGQVLAVLVTAPDGTSLSGNGSGSPGPDSVTTDENGEFVLSYALSGTLPDGSPYMGQEGQYTIQVLDTARTLLASEVFSDSLGGFHSCALTAIGGVKCWGYNWLGQIGDGSFTFSRPTPIDVVGLSSGATQISVGGFHTCALMADGGVKCWGSNSYGRLGDGTQINRNTPVDVIGLSSDVYQVIGGNNYTCAVMTSGEVKCWGWNGYGQLGDGSTTSRLTPVEVYGLSDVKQVSAGYYHTCALMENGSVKCWGDNRFGQLGDGTTINHLTPVDVIELSSEVVQLSVGFDHSCVLTVDNQVQCWGNNRFGQLGDGTTASHFTAVKVSNLEADIVQISAGGYHTCALTVDSGAKCWGRNSDGQLGNGTPSTTYPYGILTPVDVVGLTSGVAQISAGGSYAGGYHTCALSIFGGVKCWGDNYAGGLGDGTTIDHYIPVDVVGLSSGVVRLPDGPLYYNQPPTANPGGPYLGEVNAPIQFDGSASSDPDGDPLTYAWDFDDGAIGDGAMPIHSYTSPGVYNVCLTVNDSLLDSPPSCTLAVVYDPDGGFVTGGGWYWSMIGAYKLDPNTWDYANFGFFSKYTRGANVPMGQTEFQLQTAAFNFHSSNYQWLVVNQGETNAQFKGEGTINGELAPNGALYKFMIWAGDNDPATDTFRIKIWYEAGDEFVVYDNGFDQPIGSGSIQIHSH